MLNATMSLMMNKYLILLSCILVNTTTWAEVESINGLLFISSWRASPKNEDASIRIKGCIISL